MVPGNGGTRSAGSAGAIVAGFAHELVLHPRDQWEAGDHAYRSGAFRSAVV